jgi:uncharacterized protein (DUF736 family)
LSAASLLTPQQPVTTFFPWPLRAHSSRKPRKSCPGCPLLRAGPFGVRVDRLRSVASHRGRDGRPGKLKGRDNATIGTFTSTGNGFSGTVRTLALNAKAKLVRVENPSDKGPHFRIFAGNVELGAAWQKTVRATERDYLSVKLDDPSFPAPIYATLIEVEGQDGLQLIWSRPNRD